MAQQVHMSVVQPQRPSGSHDQLEFHGSLGGFVGSTGATGASRSCLVLEPNIAATASEGCGPGAQAFCAVGPKNGALSNNACSRAP